MKRIDTEVVTGVAGLAGAAVLGGFSEERSGGFSEERSGGFSEEKSAKISAEAAGRADKFDSNSAGFADKFAMKTARERAAILIRAYFELAQRAMWEDASSAELKSVREDFLAWFYDPADAAAKREALTNLLANAGR